MHLSLFCNVPTGIPGRNLLLILDVTTKSPSETFVFCGISVKFMYPFVISFKSPLAIAVSDVLAKDTLTLLSSSIIARTLA